MPHAPFDLQTMFFNRTYELFASRWKVYLIYAIGEETYRMGQLQRMFPAISRVTLTGYLQDLEREGYVSRLAYPAPPLRVEYSLTPLGLGALEMLRPLIAWGAEH